MVVLRDLGTYVAFTEPVVAASRCLHICSMELAVGLLLFALSLASLGRHGRALESLTLELDALVCSASTIDFPDHCRAMRPAALRSILSFGDSQAASINCSKESSSNVQVICLS